MVKQRTSYIVGCIFGVLIRAFVYIYNKLFFWFQNKPLMDGLKKTAVYPGMIKAPFLQKGDKITHLKKLNKGQNILENRKKVVYTCVTGGYDDIKPVFFRPDNCDFLIFTDNPELKVNGWQTIVIENFLDLTPVLLARMVKLLPHRFLPNYDLSIWIDANYDILADISELFAYIDEKPMAVFKHIANHKTLKEEATLNIKLGKACNDLISKQINHYYAHGFKDNISIIETGILIRQHLNPLLMEAMELWWHELKSYTHRDQISLPYVLWKTRLPYNYVEGNLWKTNLFVRRKHLKQ